MNHLLYTPFSSPQTLSLNVELESTQDTRIMRVFAPLAEAIGESGLKATATGNLPLKFCKAMAERFATFFGLAELELKTRKMSLEPYLVRKSKLLDCFVVFK